MRNMNTNEGTFTHYAADIRLWDVAYKYVPNCLSIVLVFWHSVAIAQ